MKKAIVTGGTGYIGSHLVRQLMEEGWQVSLIAQPEFGYHNVSDVLDRIEIFEYTGNVDELIAFFSKVAPDAVFHLAAAVLTSYQPHQISTLIQSNIQFGTEVLEAMTRSGCSKIVSTGSIWQSFNGELYNPVDLYAASKQAFETVLKYYTEACGINAVTLRIFDVYGEDDKRPKLLNLVRDIAFTDRVLDVSPAQQRLDMVHISDICSAYVAAYHYLTENRDVKNAVFGVYSGRRIKLQELLLKFGEILQIPVQVNFGGKPYKAREVMEPFDGLEVIPGWTAQVDLDEGLSRFRK